MRVRSVAAKFWAVRVERENARKSKRVSKLATLGRCATARLARACLRTLGKGARRCKFQKRKLRRRKIAQFQSASSAFEHSNRELRPRPFLSLKHRAADFAESRAILELFSRVCGAVLRDVAICKPPKSAQSKCWSKSKLNLHLHLRPKLRAQNETRKWQKSEFSFAANDKNLPTFCASLKLERNKKVFAFGS